MRQRKRHQPTHKRSLKKVLGRSRLLFFSFSALLAILLVIQSTYAWETFQDSKENEFGNVDFNVALKEKFDPNFEWEPGRQTVKEVYVRNEGNQPAFVRLRAEEFLVLFQMDIEGASGKEGTGNVSHFPGKVATIDRDLVTTWRVGDYYKKSPTAIYQAVKSAPTTLSTTGEGFIVEQDKLARNATDLSFVQLNFGQVKDYTPSLTTKYWLYGNDGYYYYSERLPSGGSSSLFLKSTTLSQSTPNRLKEALYKLNIYMDAQEPRATVLGQWGHGIAGDPIYDMLIGQVR